MVLKDYHVTFQASVLVAVQQLPIQEPPYWLGQQYVFYPTISIFVFLCIQLSIYQEALHKTYTYHAI